MAGDQVEQPVKLETTPSAGEEKETVAVFVSQPAGDMKSPVLSSPSPEVSANEDTLRHLRRFHLGGPTEGRALEPAGDELLPALLAPFQDASKIRYDYPLFLFPAGEAEREKLAVPLADFFKEAVSGFAPGDDQARILKDNLARVERFVRDALEVSAAAVDAHELLEHAAHALQDELKLDETNRTHLQGDLDRLLSAAPPRSRLLGYGEHATVHLLLHAASNRQVLRRRAFTFHVNQVVRQLRSLLEVERTKAPDTSHPRAVEVAMGDAGARFIDPVALAETMGRAKGRLPIPSERRERIEHALATLEGFLSERQLPVAVFVHEAPSSATRLDGEGDYEIHYAADPCLAASSLFEHHSGELARIFRAVRVAQLELSESYAPELHDPWFAAFGWEAFSRDELLLLPYVIAFETADRIAGTGLLSLSRLLRSGRPVQVVVDVAAGKNPGVDPGEDPLASYRFELGYFGMSHREAFVAESSIARPRHLIDGYVTALDIPRTGLHLVHTGTCGEDDGPRLSPWLQAGAAIEGRAHPLFRYNPEAGRSWAQCMDFSENPAPGLDWPQYPLTYREGGADGGEKSMSVAFTFIDFALLDGAHRDHFRLIPEGFVRDELIALESYLDLETGEALKRLPHVWAVDGSSSLRRVVVSRELVLSCQDRLGYWRTLQSLAGTRNEYAEKAAAAGRAEALAEAAAERERLEKAHAEEVARVREETAGEVMQRLTEVLMGLDLSRPVPVAASKPAAATTEVAPAEAPAAEKETEEAAAPVVEEEEEVSFDQPWIDSVLCTSCNDCMKINQLLFVYNENKQAMIGDPKSGTFEQLVIAAEKCPARCIHPGKPQNPDEPNLDELIERAKPFN